MVPTINNINRLVVVTETKLVPCEVRGGPLYMNFKLQSVNTITVELVHGVCNDIHPTNV
jgi:hypothetical protein